MAENRHYALAREAILAALTAYTGTTTEDGATPGNNTLICADLIGVNDFISEKTILIGSGDAKFEDKGASSFVSGTGTITVVSPFSHQIKKGTLFRVLNISIGDLAAIKDQVDKLAGSEADTQIAARDLTAAGGGTSGENGADILTIPTTTRKKVHMLIVSMKNCQAAATITVRMYTKVNGVWEKFYHQAFTQGTDPDAIMAINGTLAILADLRVEMHSSDALDNNVTVPYSYILEDME